MTGEYAAAGVDIEAGEKAVEGIKEAVRSTYRDEVLGDIGGFGGLFAVPKGYREPVLVAATDGVGTKMIVAEMAGRFDTIGLDLVAMCVDDLVCQGAEPLFFLDYISTGKLDPERVESLVAGIARGCRQAGCALIGGEMAEHPGAMKAEQLDVAGFAVGVVERNGILRGSTAEDGDVLIGLPSPGLRSNGYSLARRVLLEQEGLGLDDELFPGRTVGDELLLPSVIYSPAVRHLLAKVDVRAVAHVTGGGLVGNLPRVLPGGLDALVDRGSWDVPPVFDEIQRRGGIDDGEMANVFNLGIGMVVAVAPDEVDRSIEVLQEAGHDARVIGGLVPGASSGDRVRFS